jgi:hypothetical protein
MRSNIYKINAETNESEAKILSTFKIQAIYLKSINILILSKKRYYRIYYFLTHFFI